jgi:hypothetical protein
MRTALIELTAIFISSTVVAAHLAPPDTKRAARIVRLTEWVNKAGFDSNLQKLVLEKFGFDVSALPGLPGKEDRVPAKRKAYFDQVEIYAFHIVQVQGSPIYVLGYNHPGGNELWNIASSGAILNYLVFNDNFPRGGLPKDPNLPLFNKALGVLEKEIHKAGY